MNLIDYSKMMNGKPQTLVSKFKISYNLLLNLISIGNTDFTCFAKKSMIQNDLDSEIKEVYNKMTSLELRKIKTIPNLLFLLLLLSKVLR